jgi:hypothetical protein
VVFFSFFLLLWSWASGGVSWRVVSCRSEWFVKRRAGSGARFCWRAYQLPRWQILCGVKSSGVTIAGGVKVGSLNAVGLVK